MKNKMVDLKNHLFQALERLNDENLSEEQIKTEITRAQAVAEIGKVIVDGAKTSLMYAKITGNRPQVEDGDFLDDKPIVKKLTA
jgi:hypothetical protein